MFEVVGNCIRTVETIFTVSVIYIGIAKTIFIAICNSCRNSKNNVYICLLSILKTLRACVRDTKDACDMILKVCNAMPLCKDTWRFM